MRRFSTHIGVYAIWLIAAFCGALSVTGSGGKAAQNAEIIQRANTSGGNEVITNRSYYLGKNDNSKAGHSTTLQANKDLRTSAVVETTFFTHSATIQHYISTI